MKECFIITSYCNTKEKINSLNKCISNIKGLGVDILLHAHYPIEDNIQNKVNYYIYSENPNTTIINNGVFYEKVFTFWKYFSFDKIKLIHIINDHTYSVFKQIKESIFFLKNLSEYDIFHVINYDIHMQKELYEKQLDLIKLKGSVFYKNFIDYSDLNKNEDNLEPWNNVLMFAFGLKLDSELIKKLESLNDIDYYKSELYSETYFYNNFVKKFNFYVEKSEKFREHIYKLYEYEISVMGFSNKFILDDSDPFYIYEIYDVYFFGGILDDNYCFYIWNVNNNVIININGNKYEIKEKKNKFISTLINKNEKLNITINNNEISKNLLSQYKMNKIEIEN